MSKAGMAGLEWELLLSLTELFDAIPDTVFFLKDLAGRYCGVNTTLVERTGRVGKSELLGRTAAEIFPGALGQRISRQDLDAMSKGKMLAAELELHLYKDGSEGWCITWKSPVRDKAGRVVGLMGLSRDVAAMNDTSDTKALSEALSYARAHLDGPLRVSDLAARAGLSAFRFDQRIRALFGLSAGQYLTRLRIDLARELLRHSAKPLSEIALDCGYSDQTAFARQFRKVAQITPQAYRSHAARSPAE